MSFSSVKNQILVSCAPNLVEYLKSEITGLNLPVLNAGFTYVETEGAAEDIFKLNFFLRTANHVYLLLKKFNASSVDDLYEELKNMDWEEILFADKYLSIESWSDHSSINNTMFLNQKVKDAIVDRLRDKTGSRPETGPLKDEAVVYVHWPQEGPASVYLDTSGQPLYKHGYRIHPGYAPLQESLAAAMILASKWDRNSTFINPMCGSGTLAIEAALMAANIPAGILKQNFGFMHVKIFSPEDFEVFREKNEVKIPEKLPFEIIASDLNRVAIQKAKEHAKRAGVEHLISFFVRKAEETPMPESKGVLFFNPPYGERLGSAEELIPLYQGLGDFMKQKANGYLGYVLTASKELGKRIGLKPKRKIPFKNGALDCLLYEFELYTGTKKFQDKVFN